MRGTFMKKTGKILSLFLALTLLCCVLSPLSSAYTAFMTPELKTDKAVSLWSRKDYKGQHKDFTAGEYPDVSFPAKSIDIPAEYVVTAYSGKNFTGTEYFLNDSQNAFLRYDFGLGITFIQGIRSMKVALIESDGIDITELDDAGKNQIMIDYAPRIWMAEGDPYEAVSMEFVMEKFTKSVDDDGTGRISTIEQPTSPFSILETYYGEQETAKAYAFWIEKEGGYIDISYFQFCPFDSGKYIHLLHVMAGAHPGDWEHVTLRFSVYEAQGRTYMRPVKVAFPAHTFAARETWEALNKVDETHIEIYCAAGTHGMYPFEGNHVYLDLGPIEKLTDVCTKGEAWDLWEENKLETFEHDPKTGSRALAGSPWAHLFGYDKGENSLSVRHWGNQTYFPIFLGAGPDGPQYKTELHDRYSFK